MAEDNVITPPNKLDIWKFFLTYGIVIAVIVAYGFFINYLLSCITVEEPYWTRLILIFSSLEAITFGALGYVFGKEITKKIAKTAEEGKKDAEKEAKKAKDEAKAAEQEKQEVKEKALIIASLAKRDNQGLNLAGMGKMGVAPDDDNDGRGAGTTSNLLLDKINEFFPELN